MEKEKGKFLSLPLSIVLSAAILTGAWLWDKKFGAPLSPQKAVSSKIEVAGEQGAELPVTWGDLGKKLVSAGVISEQIMRELYGERGGFTKEYENLLLGQSDEKIKITRENSAYLLNLLWALGLSNANPILTDKKEMGNPAYGGAANFASTGGWTLAEGDAMEHYNRHMFFTLTEEQQVLVDKISHGIYRPCCNNPTHFPDCNHGMAMLGLLELMASQGASEEEMWNAALAVNSYWFPDNYETIASYLAQKGISWQNVKPQEILSANYSSGSGYAKIVSQMSSSPSRGGGSCGA